MGHPKFFYELQFCKKMKNEATMGSGGEQRGDEERCEHACKCDALVMPSLVREIALLFCLNFGIDNDKNSGFANESFCVGIKLNFSSSS